MIYTGNAYNWNQVLRFLQTKEKGTIFRFPKNIIDHPIDAGARPSMGLPLGQESDYRWVLSDCSGLHARDFGVHYEAHIDQVDPECSLIEHMRKDAPGAYVAGTAAIGAAVGILLGKSPESTLAGGLLGALLGALTLPKEK